VATLDMGRKGGGAAVPISWEAGTPRIQCGLGRGLLPYQVASSSIQPFGHNEIRCTLPGEGIGDVSVLSGIDSNSDAREMFS